MKINIDTQIEWIDYSRAQWLDGRVSGIGKVNGMEVASYFYDPPTGQSYLRAMPESMKKIRLSRDASEIDIQEQCQARIDQFFLQFGENRKSMESKETNREALSKYGCDRIEEFKEALTGAKILLADMNKNNWHRKRDAALDILLEVKT